MRKKRIIILVIYSLVVLIGFSQTILAYKNEVHRHPLPDSPEKYTFFHNPYLLPNEIPNDMKTDYGTHDWIADAALRLLYQLNPSDWDWLLDNPSDPNPSWKSNYGLNGYHHAVRSYIYYLLATQWPDFENAPAVIHFKNEGEQIKNGIHNLKTWIGRTDYHTYHFNVYKHSTIENYFYFIPKLPSKEGSDQHPQEAPQYAQRFGDLAIECLSHQEDGESWAKVETAAFYLGCMTHYIADLACPPHLSVGDNK